MLAQILAVLHRPELLCPYLVGHQIVVSLYMTLTLIV